MIGKNLKKKSVTDIVRLIKLALKEVQMKNKFLILGCLTFILIVASGCQKKAQSKDITPITTTTSESSLVATSETVAANKTQTSTDTTTETSVETATQSSIQNSTETTTETSSENKPKAPTETSTPDTLATSTSSELSTSEATVSSTTTETSTSESAESESEFDLGIIYYEHLNLNDPIQANAKYLGCYLVDDGETVNFVPLMSDTVQNLHEYTSGHGNEEYYQQVINYALETSNLTRGKPVSILDREGGVVIITAENGKITYSV